MTKEVLKDSKTRSTDVFFFLIKSQEFRISFEDCHRSPLSVFTLVITAQTALGCASARGWPLWIHTFGVFHIFSCVSHFQICV